MCSGILVGYPNGCHKWANIGRVEVDSGPHYCQTVGQHGWPDQQGQQKSGGSHWWEAREPHHVRSSVGHPNTKHTLVNFLLKHLSFKMQIAYHAHGNIFKIKRQCKHMQSTEQEVRWWWSFGLKFLSTPLSPTSQHVLWECIESEPWDIFENPLWAP